MTAFSIARRRISALRLPSAYHDEHSEPNGGQNARLRRAARKPLERGHRGKSHARRIKIRTPSLISPPTFATARRWRASGSRGEAISRFAAHRARHAPRRRAGRPRGGFPKHDRRRRSWSPWLGAANVPDPAKKAQLLLEATPSAEAPRQPRIDVAEFRRRRREHELAARLEGLGTPKRGGLCGDATCVHAPQPDAE